MQTPSKGQPRIQPTMPIPSLLAKFHLSVTGVSDVIEILAQHGAEVALPDDLEAVGARRTPPRKARSYWQGGGHGQRAGSMVGVFLDASHAQSPRAECDGRGTAQPFDVAAATLLAQSA